MVLRQEQEEYQKEGIAWQEVKYFNNQVICDLVEKPHQGIIAIIDEACLNVGKINDEVCEICNKYMNIFLNYFIFIYLDAIGSYGLKTVTSSALF